MKQKVSRKQFKEFCAEFTRLQMKMGLNGYKVYFLHTALDGCFANITCDQRQVVATVRLTTTVSDDDAAFFNPIAHAKHEAIHLLVHRLEERARQRYITTDEIYEATEELVRRIEQIAEVK